MKSLSRVYTALILLFMYAPIFVLIVYSFNASNSTSVFEGFSLKWYSELFKDGETLKALYNTLILALLSSVIATILGTAAAVGISYMKNGPIKSIIMTITNIPMMNADIVTGVSLMLLFVFVGGILGISGVLGFTTLLIAHVTFNLPYVILSVLPKLKQLDPNLSEAAQDLGCTPLQSFFKVVLPSIMPGIITGLMMSFTLSLDDFVISYFVSGPQFQTLPLRIYSMTKRRVTPDMYALSTLMFVVILVLLILINTVKDDKKTLGKGSAKK
ncbi:MAG: ABC transporter permease [Ruminococcaceae bacterium]|nr:ABC transporter permease [Oscillospiraceae bacterium]